ncbi:HAD family hydrolase [Pseudobacteriovorax antillogorgiicola]|uniref:Haloacid dehalogenase superfamily, subfamily IA, variant 3 with third motif having DD or ED n=1 Tax=Pseudobacteriovorax antillogorgiicola TaxID=1513793 RepID=A0A1Y6BDR2_9BACT|nr:HAD family phosphatase [Pseudobacteriovorax antillogorgiicola]TCS58666.1 HAD superfamily hydrolase (TIGR01509 family) [Pseudobacteriovorax antillogorgiicola]SME96152.1 haloacid dehalogenase superfamily, subfamily IA, variant 3 with third motif having DD or ED [Pseudobacteriovorax antillogorgiicola]
MEIKAVIFDFDGVIAETEGVHRLAWIALAEDLSRPLPEGFLDRGIGSTMDKLAWELYEFWEGAVDLQEIHDEKANHFRRLLAETKDVLVGGVIEAFQTFHQMGLPMGIATSSPRREIEPLLETHAVKDLFQSIVTLDCVDNPKPHPEAYLRSVANLKQQPENCLVFEDSILGTTAARAAGTNVVGVLTSFPREKLEPLIDAIDHFHQLPQVLKKLRME